MTIKGMNRALANTIGIVCSIGPAILVYVVGSLWSHSTGLYAVAIWTGIYLAWNMSIVGQQDWKVVERFGQFHDVKFRGLRFYCLLGLVDTIKAEGNLLERKETLFKNISIDFTNGSAPIEAYLWYKNCRPKGTNREMTEDILAYVYTNKGPETRVIQIVENYLRPRFQEMDVDTASKSRADIVNGTRDIIAAELKSYGLYFSKEPLIVIVDIRFSEEVNNLRQKRLRGQTTAEEIENESDGYRRGIEAIMYRERPDGTQEMVCDFETASNIWREQQTRKMFEKTG